MLILDGQNKRVHVFDSNGFFDRTIDLNFTANYFEKIGREHFAFIGGGSSDKLVITDISGRVIRAFFPPNGLNTLTLNQPLDIVGDTMVTYHEFLNDTIYSIAKDQVNPYVFIDFGVDAFRSSEIERLSLSQRQNAKQIVLSGYTGYIKYFFETAHFIYLVFFDEGSPHVCIYSKERKKIHVYDAKSIENDLTFSELMPYILSKDYESDVLIAAIHPHTLKSFVADKRRNMNNPAFDNISYLQAF